MMARRLLAYAWAAPNTVVGLALAGLARATGGDVRVVAGVVEASGGAVAWLLRRAVPLPGGAAALTLGHVVIARDVATACQTRRHERAHVRQYERWGAFFLPVYAIASMLAWGRGRNFYHDNYFEQEARAAERRSEPHLPQTPGQWNQSPRSTA